MVREYTVHMAHKMLSVVTVKAKSEAEAIEKAYAASLEDPESWTEHSTQYGEVVEGQVIEDDE